MTTRTPTGFERNAIIALDMSCDAGVIWWSGTDGEDVMAEFVTVAKVTEIAEGEGQAFGVNGRMVAVFNENGEFLAIDDLCPHMGASLAGGHVENGVVACPWHAWRFCVRDGTWCDNPKIKVDSFRVRVQDGDVQVSVPPREPTPSSENDP